MSKYNILREHLKSGMGSSEQDLLDDLLKLAVCPIRCPRDNVELELVDERMDWQHFKCPDCGMKVTCEDVED
jgi:peptide subunit release factor 1 (eRF1)